MLSRSLQARSVPTPLSPTKSAQKQELRHPLNIERDEGLLESIILVQRP